MNKKTAMTVSDYNIDDLEIGMSVHYKTTITKNEVEGFAEISGDISPLHVDEEFGKKSVFGTNIVHGVLIASHFSTVVGVMLPGKNALLTGMDIDFVKPVPVGSEVMISAAIKKIQTATRMIELRLLAFYKGEICVKGVAKAKVMEPKSANLLREGKK